MEETTTHLALCRAGWEAVLAQELALPAGAVVQTDSGWLAWRGPVGQPLPEPGMFERQRMPNATHAEGGPPAALAQHLLAAALPRLEAAPAPLALHVFAPDPTGERSQSPRAARLEAALQRVWGQRTPTLAVGAPAASGSVWQVCVVEGGAWWALTPAAALLDPYPGGVHRMARDADAPSRSALKLEEALELLAAWGALPRAHERVIDLGAAPGGWSHAMLRRGCRVLAVDNGPLKLHDLDSLPGALTHLRADALRLTPPPGWLPADWLLADLLVPPGVCLGLLRKWIGGGWMRRAVVNVKLPQREPLVALRPLRAYLREVHGLRWRLRQLYHDRREVTLLAELKGGAAPRSPAPGRTPPRAEAPARADAPARNRRPSRPAPHRRRRR